MAIKKHPSGVYRVEFQLLGRRIHRSARTRDRRVAWAFEAKLRRELLDMPRDSKERRSMTLGEAGRRYLSEHLEPQARRAATAVRERYTVNRIVTLMGGEDVPLGDIDSAAVSGLKSRLLALGRSKGTVNRHLAFLRALLRKAEREWGVETAKPVFVLFRLENQRTRVVSEEEEGRLLEALSTRRRQFRGEEGDSEDVIRQIQQFAHVPAVQFARDFLARVAEERTARELLDLAALEPGD
jgi:hypothetical protein